MARNYTIVGAIYHRQQANKATYTVGSKTSIGENNPTRVAQIVTPAHADL